MEILFVTLSESASIDIATNRLSIFHVLDDINSPSFPVVFPRMSLVAILERSQSETTSVKMNVKAFLDEDLLFEREIPVNFQSYVRSRIVADINGLIFAKPGILKVDLAIGADASGSWTIRVNNTGAPTISTPSSTT